MAALGPGGPREAAASEAAPPFEARLELEAADSAARTTFAVGQPVVLVLRVRNTSEAARTLELPSAQPYDFAVFAEGGEVWRWSRGRMFAQMLTELRFEPGEEKVWREKLGPSAGAATPLSPGRYRAEGSLRALGGFELRAVREFAVE
jgi:hypothetical protein